MLKKLMAYRQVVTLIPHTGIQFLDDGFSEDALEQNRVQRFFWPEIESNRFDEEGRAMFDLHVVDKDEDEFVWTSDDEALQRRLTTEDGVYAVNSQKALDIFDGVWVPAPFLRLLERGVDRVQRFDEGPDNWARVRIVKLPEGESDENSNQYRVVWSFDTALSQRREGRPYAAPEPRDAEDQVHFGLAGDPASNRTFLKNGWVRDWLRQIVAAKETARRERLITPQDLHDQSKYARLGEYWAAYLVFIETLLTLAPPPQLRFVDTVQSASQRPPVEVDLVLDIGNSRTCGMWIEQFKGEMANITNAFRLELRDLSRPELVYEEPFKSWVEFCPADFGPEDLSQASGRSIPGFYWPSPVRIGPEAARLATYSDGTEGVSGMSSPKRYIWDEDPRPLPWANNPFSRPSKQDPAPVIKGPFSRYFAEDGGEVRPGKMPGAFAHYSRSSIYTFLMMELILQALCQINSVSARYQRRDSEIPRRLRRIIITVPSATPIAEQKVMRRRIRHALNVVWDVLGWPGAKSPQSRRRGAEPDPATAIFTMPEIKLDWDEASCAHLVFLYNEIRQKYRMSPVDTIQLLGRGRTGEEGGPALRVASMDIGGGTTDLMIIQHEVSGRETITPKQIFREGFRLAGDDILKGVVESIILPSLGRSLRTAGLMSPRGLLERLFGGDRSGVEQSQNTLRGLFVNQVLVPAATGVLSYYEKSDPRRQRDEVDIALSHVLPEDHIVSESIRNYLEEAAQREGAPDFNIDTVRITFTPGELAGVIKSVVENVIDDLCDVVRAYECDYLLITGRPARLPIIHDLVLRFPPVPIDRIVSMDRYEIGAWYPFRSVDRRITDPKTTVSVGGLLCQICEGMTDGLLMRSSTLRMWSTARFLGKMDVSDRIADRDVVLNNLDLDSPKGGDRFEVQMEAPFYLGFRQLPYEHWKTTPLYYVAFTNSEQVAAFSGNLPITLKMERKNPESVRNANDDDYDEAGFEDFIIEDASDRAGEPRQDNVRLRLKTMRTVDGGPDGYWMDTGALNVTHQI